MQTKPAGPWAFLNRVEDVAAVRCLRTIVEATGGTAAVEFAIIVPLLLAMLVPTIDLGMGLYQQQQVQAAAQAGVQYALTAGYNSTAIQNAVTSATGLSSITASPAPAQSCGCPSGSTISAATCGSACSSGIQAGQYVTVNAAATYSPLLSYPTLGSSVNLTATAIVRIQ
jgi:Flp pilus assembly protein TadG